jgi:hypothetical protein
MWLDAGVGPLGIIWRMCGGVTMACDVTTLMNAVVVGSGRGRV